MLEITLELPALKEIGDMLMQGGMGIVLLFDPDADSNENIIFVPGDGIESLLVDVGTACRKIGEEKMHSEY